MFAVGVIWRETAHVQKVLAGEAHRVQMIHLQDFGAFIDCELLLFRLIGIVGRWCALVARESGLAVALCSTGTLACPDLE